MPEKCTVVAEVYEALRARDLSALLTKFAPDVEISTADRLPWGGRHRGLGGLANFLKRLACEIEFEVVTERLVQAGDYVIHVGRTRGRALATGREFDLEEVHVWRFRDCKITGFTCYLDAGAMLEALRR